MDGPNNPTLQGQGSDGSGERCFLRRWQIAIGLSQVRCWKMILTPGRYKNGWHAIGYASRLSL
jgi:hypothetical protein